MIIQFRILRDIAKISSVQNNKFFVFWRILKVIFRIFCCTATEVI